MASAGRLVILSSVKWKITAVLLAAVGFLVAPLPTGNGDLIDDAGAVASSSHDTAHGILPSHHRERPASLRHVVAVLGDDALLPPPTSSLIVRESDGTSRPHSIRADRPGIRGPPVQV